MDNATEATMTTIGYLTREGAEELGILGALENGGEYDTPRVTMEPLLVAAKPASECWAVDEDGSTTYLPTTLR